MNITSFYFLCFYVIILFVYYIFPRRVQWIVLLIANFIFLLCSGDVRLLGYPFFTVFICYLGTRWMIKVKSDKIRRFIATFTVLSNLLILFSLKYVSFPISTFNGLLGIFGNGYRLPMPEFLVPLGISFYTFTMIGYVIDVYRGIAVCQNNFAKFATFGLYFPLLTSGPIVNYREYGEGILKGYTFKYEQVTFGLQRILWGFFKKLVIAERMGKVVDTVYGNPMSYAGGYVWIATMAFAFQLYTDFSGCMDIVLGISQTFGISLPENFQTPFFSKSIAEYWRRWHITLGVWMKEYVFYPLLRTRFFINLGKWNKEKFGKKKGKQYTTFFSMLILWFIVGLWHGGAWKYIIGSGLLHWCYIVIEELIEKNSKKRESKLIEYLNILKTFFLVCIGFVFFRASNVHEAMILLKNGLKLGNLGQLLTGGIFSLGLDWVEFGIAVVSLVILLIVSILQQTGSVRTKIAQKKCGIRWVIWYALLFYVILLGCYGPGYSAAEFIYQGF